MKNWILIITTSIALLAAARIRADDKPADAPKPEGAETRKLLSEHHTVAKFTGIQFHRCLGLTALCPDNCGHSGDFASFEIVAYLSYTKAGEYGDPQATTFMFQVDDNHKTLKVSKELAGIARGLQAGDTVLLDWRHDYVTRKEAGGSSSFPERPITKLEKITPKEADELVKKAANK